MVQPIDQGAIMASGQALVPDYAAEMLRQRLAGIQEQNARSNAARVALDVQQTIQEQQQEEAFQAALAEAQQSKDPGALAKLMMRFPKASEAIKRAYEMQDEAKRRGDLSQMAQIYSAAKNGRYDLAAQTYEARLKADEEAGGETDEMERAILDGLRSGDPTQQQYALASLGAGLSAMTGEDHFSTTLDRLQKAEQPDPQVIDGVAVDMNPRSPTYLKELYETPFPRVVPGPDGSFFVRERIGGGGLVATPEQQAESERLEAYFRSRGVAIPEATDRHPAAGPAPVVPGNIDLGSRPKVRNGDGSFSTIESISIGTDRGEALIPTIAPDGRRLSQDEAVARYERTGEHLGIFRTSAEATNYARALSNSQGVRYGAGQPSMTAAANFGRRFGTVTSTFRTPERNKAVGGAPNSHHLRGAAVDIARKPGVSHAQIEQAYRQAGFQIIESLDEGDHSHFAFGGGSAVPQVRSLQEARALPKGTVFLTPDGRRKVR